MTTVNDGLFQYGGMPVGSFNFLGKAYWVKPVSGSDSRDGKSPGNAFKTLAKALSVGAYGDVVFLVAEGNSSSATTDYQSTALDWNVDGLHLIGVGVDGSYGKRARIAQLSTVKTIEDLFTVSADNCIIANIAVYQGVSSSTATSPRAFVVSGERNHLINCEMYGNGDAGGSTDTAGARSLAVTGAENTFTSCTIGLDTVIRATQTAEVLVGNIARTTFNKCFFNTYTSLTTFKIVTYSAPDRFVLFNDCILNAVNNITSAVQPTGALAAATSVNGQIIGRNSIVSGCVNVTTADDAKVFWSGPVGGAVDSGLSTGVDIA